MRGKKTKFRQTLFALALLLLNAAAIAQPVVLVAPSDGNSLRPIYLNEVRNYTLTATNVSDSDVHYFGVEIFVPPELSIPMGLEGRRSRYFSFPLLVPGQSEQKIFQIKAVSTAPEPVELVSRFGQPPSAGALSTKIIIAPPPLAIGMSVMPIGALAGEQGSVFVSISNSSQGALSGIRAEVLSRSSTFGNQPLEAPTLAPGQGVSAREFKYSKSENSGHIVVRVLFEDSSGRHVIEQEVAESPAQNSPLPLIAAGFVALLVIFSLYWKKFRGGFGQGSGSGSHSEHGKGHH